MKYTTFFIITTFLFSCHAPVHLSSGSIPKVTFLGLHPRYPDGFDPKKKHLIDSVVEVTINAFNKEHHKFQISQKLDGEGYLDINIEKCRFVSKSTRTWAYIVSGFGLSILPIDFVIWEPIPFFFWGPENKIKYNFYLSPSLTGSPQKKQTFVIAKTSLFHSIKHARESTLSLFGETLNALLVELDEKMSNK